MCSFRNFSTYFRIRNKMFLISIATSIHGGPKIDMGEAIVVFHCPDQIIILSSSESLRLHDVGENTPV